MFQRALKFFSTKLRKPTLPPVEPLTPSPAAPEAERAGLLQRPTRQDVRQVYRLILGREPESEQMVDEQMQYASLASLRIAAIRSVEFHDKYLAVCPEAVDPYWSATRRTLVFIHLEKTAGTTLRDLLAAQFEEGRVYPGPNIRIYSLPVAQLAHYDFFAGHFELDSIRYIPRRNIETLSVFREPRSRLISWYRFHRAHPLHGDYAANPLVVLANQFSAEEFFELPEVRSSPLVYNRYLLAFARSFSWFVEHRESLHSDDLQTALRDAKTAISSLTAIGITEQFELSVQYFCKVFDLSPPSTIRSLNITNDMPKTLARFRPVESVSMTPRLTKALDELTAYDQEIYEFAVGEFAKRCASVGVIAGSGRT